MATDVSQRGWPPPAGSASGQTGDLDQPRRAAGTCVLVLLMSLGCVGVEFAYAGRLGTSWGSTLYWSGDVLLFGAAAYAVVRHSISQAATVSVLVVLALCTFLIKVAYSPLHFSFPDEFQHWRTLSDILTTHHLFHANPALPVSPSYPGLEVATSAVMATTGLSVFVSGLLVSGFAHLLLIVLVFAVFRRVSGSVRVGGLAAIVFATEPHFQYFDEIFAYQTVALPLFALVLLAALTIADRQERSVSLEWWITGLLAAAAVVVTHHVTTLALIVILVVVSAVALTRGRFAPAIFTILCAALAAGWMTTKARDTFSYLAHPVEVDVLAPFARGGSGGSNLKGNALPPLADRVLTYTSVVAILCLLAVRWGSAWAHRRHPVVSHHSSDVAGVQITGRRIGWTAMAIAAAAYPLTLGVRLVAADGSELAGRALTFAFVPMAPVAAAVLVSRFGRGLRTVAIVSTVGLLTAGGLAAGWPPWWERVPGPFRPASFEQGLDAENTSAAVWAGSHLVADEGVGADFMSSSLMGTYGRLISLQGVAPLFYARRFRQIDADTVRAESIRYIVVDRRMTASLPAVGGYFSINPPALVRKRMPRRSLAKFDSIRGVDRVYDGGAIKVYDLRGSRYLPD